MVVVNRGLIENSGASFKPALHAERGNSESPRAFQHGGLKQQSKSHDDVTSSLSLGHGLEPGRYHQQRRGAPPLGPKKPQRGQVQSAGPASHETVLVRYPRAAPAGTKSKPAPKRRQEAAKRRT